MFQRFDLQIIGVRFCLHILRKMDDKKNCTFDIALLCKLRVSNGPACKLVNISNDIESTYSYKFRRVYHIFQGFGPYL